MRSFSPKVIENLKYYVYALYKPNENLPFYIGKGKGNRVFAHIKEAEDIKNKELNAEDMSDKLQVIFELLKDDLEPRIEILRHGLEKESDALVAESVAIDLLMESLTNKQSGYKSRMFGKKDLNQILHQYEEEKVEIEEKAILIRINKYINPDTHMVELYDRTRCAWRVSYDKVKNTKYAFAVFESKILEVYKIAAWLPNRSTMHSNGGNFQATHRTIETDPHMNRYEFVGQLAEEEIRNKYCGKYINDYTYGAQNPIAYKNV